MQSFQSTNGRKMKYKWHGCLEEKSPVSAKTVEGSLIDGGGHQIIKPNKKHWSSSMSERISIGGIISGSTCL